MCNPQLEIIPNKCTIWSSLKYTAGEIRICYRHSIQNDGFLKASDLILMEKSLFSLKERTSGAFTSKCKKAMKLSRKTGMWKYYIIYSSRASSFLHSSHISRRTELGLVQLINRFRYGWFLHVHVSVALTSTLSSIYMHLCLWQCECVCVCDWVWNAFISATFDARGSFLTVQAGVEQDCDALPSEAGSTDRRCLLRRL